MRLFGKNSKFELEDVRAYSSFLFYIRWLVEIDMMLEVLFATLKRFGSALDLMCRKLTFRRGKI